MATRHGASKRQKERRREEKRKDKEVRRVERKTASDERGPLAEGEDPDIAGIVPGPQPLPEGFDDGEFNPGFDTDSGNDDSQESKQ